MLGPLTVKAIFNFLIVINQTVTDGFCFYGTGGNSGGPYSESGDNIHKVR